MARNPGLALKSSMACAVRWIWRVTDVGDSAMSKMGPSIGAENKTLYCNAQAKRRLEMLITR